MRFRSGGGSIIAIILLASSIFLAPSFSFAQSSSSSPSFIGAIVSDTENVFSSLISWFESLIPHSSNASDQAAAVEASQEVPATVPQTTTEQPATTTPTVPTPAPSIQSSSNNNPATDTNIFKLENSVASLIQGMRSLTAILASETPSSKLENQISSLQSALASSNSQNNAAAVYPLGDGTGLNAVSNIGQLSGVTITNANISAASIPNLSGSYLSLGGGNVTGTTTFVASIGIGTTTPISQLDLENYTVTSDGGTLTGGNPQFQINGTLDTTQGAVGHVIGAQWQWNTVGANAVNVSGLRINLEPGYTGNGLVRGIDINNLVQGTHALGIADEHGNIGATLAAQGGASNDSTIGDNIGAYAIANGSENVNVAVYGRSFDQAPSNAGYSIANIGVIGVAAHNYLGPASTEIGGFFAAGGSGNWYSELATTSTALLLDNETEAVPLIIGRVNGSNAFTVTSTGGIVSTSTTNSTSFWQVQNSSGSPLLDLDSSNLRVGIGTTTPADNLTVTNPASTATFGVVSDGASVGSGNVRLDLINGDGNKYALQYSGGGNTVLNLQYNSATKFQFTSMGTLNVGGVLGNACAMLCVSSTTPSIPALIITTGAVITEFTAAGNFGIGTANPYSRLQVTGPDAASSTSAFAIVSSASSTVFSVFDGGNAELSGTLTQSSDQRLKTNIQSLDGSSSLAAINALNPVTFNWIDPEKDGRTQLGFIAQQVQGIFPGLVSTTSPTSLTPDGTLGLNYIDLISPIVAAIQELDREITSLASTVADFAESFTSRQITATNELCIGATCIDEAQLQALLATANQNGSTPGGSDPPDVKGALSQSAPVMEINGSNPAIVQLGASYNDLGATITAPQADLNLGINTFLNGTAMNPIQIDTSEAATDTIDYVVTDTQGNTSTSTRTVIIEAPAVPVQTDDASSTATSTNS